MIRCLASRTTHLPPLFRDQRDSWEGEGQKGSRLIFISTYLLSVSFSFAMSFYTMALDPIPLHIFSSFSFRTLANPPHGPRYLRMAEPRFLTPASIASFPIVQRLHISHPLHCSLYCNFPFFSLSSSPFEFLFAPFPPSQKKE